MFTFDKYDVPLVEDDFHVAFCPDCQENQRGVWLLCPNHVEVKVTNALREVREEYGV